MMDDAPFALTDSLKVLLKDTATRLKGTERRQFMAQVVESLGCGGSVQSERELGWNRGTVRKGLFELKHGPIQDAFAQRGRQPVEAKLPQLLSDIQAIVDPQTQADPTLTSQRLYTRLSAPEVRRQLIAQKGYSDAELPSDEVIRQRLNQLGYRLKRVANAHTLRISIDAKATVKVGDYDRGGEKSG